jgi:hypothetical protein
LPQYYHYFPDTDSFDSLIISSRVEAALDTGRPIERPWRIPTLRSFRVGRQGDFPGIGLSAVALSERAWRELRDLSGESAEPLPVRTGGAKYIALNVFAVDALNERRSRIARTQSGLIISVQRYCLWPEILAGRHIFKLPQTAQNEVLVSDSFRSRVEEIGLTGLVFRRLAVVRART